MEEVKKDMTGRDKSIKSIVKLVFTSFKFRQILKIWIVVMLLLLAVHHNLNDEFLVDKLTKSLINIGAGLTGIVLSRPIKSWLHKKWPRCFSPVAPQKIKR